MKPEEIDVFFEQQKQIHKQKKATTLSFRATYLIRFHGDLYFGYWIFGDFKLS